MDNPYKLLRKLDLPVAYMKHDKKEKLPYLIYRGAGSTNLKADNKVYHSDYDYEIELYYLRKDEELERRLEELLNENEIPWEKSEDIYIPSERMYMIYYQI